MNFKRCFPNSTTIGDEPFRLYGTMTCEWTMTEPMDLNEPVDHSTHLPLLEQRVQRLLVGQPLLQACFSYGDELTLHFGERRAYSHPRMAHLFKGSLILGARASAWRVVGLDGRFDSNSIPEDEDASEAKRRFKAWAAEWGEMRVVKAMVVGQPQAAPKLILMLAGDGAPLLVEIAPASIDPAENEAPLADWELFTPDDGLLSVGPGPQWSYAAGRSAEPQPKTA